MDLKQLRKYAGLKEAAGFLINFTITRGRHTFTFFTGTEVDNKKANKMVDEIIKSIGKASPDALKKQLKITVSEKRGRPS
jgi:hypothetical protein